MRHTWTSTCMKEVAQTKKKPKNTSQGVGLPGRNPGEFLRRMPVNDKEIGGAETRAVGDSTIDGVPSGAGSGPGPMIGGGAKDLLDLNDLLDGPSAGTAGGGGGDVNVTLLRRGSLSIHLQSKGALVPMATGGLGKSILPGVILIVFLVSFLVQRRCVKPFTNRSLRGIDV